MSFFRGLYTAGLEAGISIETVDQYSQSRGVGFNWQNEADPTQSFGYIDTFNLLNPLWIDGSVLNIQSQAGGNIVAWGELQLKNFSSGIKAIFNTTSLTSSDKIFAFPDDSGTLGLLEVNQTWSGLNKFEASTNSTIYVGSSVKSGCIVMGDSDGSGVTYITANDGVLSASTTKPSICQ